MASAKIFQIGGQPTGGNADTTALLNNAIPGFSELTKSASANVGNLLNGMPSADATRTANAYFGVGSGMPGSEFIRNRGYDLYGQQGEQRRQQGLGDFLSLLGGFSGNVVPNAPQTLQNQQFGQQLNQTASLEGSRLGEQRREFDLNTLLSLMQGQRQGAATAGQLQLGGLDSILSLLK